MTCRIVCLRMCEKGVGHHGFIFLFSSAKIYHGALKFLNNNRPHLAEKLAFAGCIAQNLLFVTC